MTDAVTGNARQREIVDVASRLFSTLGYSETSMDDIADAVSIKKASLYYHFASKEELLWRVLQEGIDRLLEDAREVMEDGSLDPISRLEALLHVHAYHVNRHRAQLMVFLSERRVLAGSDREDDYLRWRREYEDLIEMTIAQGQESGEFREGEPRIIAYGIIGMYNWMVQWFDSSGELAIEDIHRSFFGLLTEGLLVDEG